MIKFIFCIAYYEALHQKAKESFVHCVVKGPVVLDTTGGSLFKHKAARGQFSVLGSHFTVGNYLR